jgi:NTE family protein
VHAWNQLAERGATAGNGPLRMHRVDGGEFLEDLPQSSRATADPALIRKLFTAGREAAAAWCEAHHGVIGKRGTVDMVAEYGDDTWLELAAGPKTGARRLLPNRPIVKSRPRR